VTCDETSLFGRSPFFPMVMHRDLEDEWGSVNFRNAS
jgi:hypothetical protein